MVNYSYSKLFCFLNMKTSGCQSLMINSLEKIQFFFCVKQFIISRHHLQILFHATQHQCWFFTISHECPFICFTAFLKAPKNQTKYLDNPQDEIVLAVAPLQSPHCSSLTNTAHMGMHSAKPAAVPASDPYRLRNWSSWQVPLSASLIQICHMGFFSQCCSFIVLQ